MPLRGYLMDPTGANVRPIDTDVWFEYPSFSPDGRHIVFESAVDRTTTSSRSNSRPARRPGSPTPPATTAGRSGRPTVRPSRSPASATTACAPRPTRIAGEATSPASITTSGSWTPTAATSAASSPEVGQFVAWSPDGQYLLISGHALFVIRPDGTGRPRSGRRARARPRRDPRLGRLTPSGCHNRRWNACTASSVRSRRTSTSSPTHGRVKPSPSIQRRRRWPGSPTSSPPAMDPQAHRLHARALGPHRRQRRGRGAHRRRHRGPRPRPRPTDRPATDLGTVRIVPSVPAVDLAEGG